MCGFAGVFNSASQINLADIADMGQLLRHRGPDEGRVWCEKSYGVAFQRLAIVDISANGSQPMLSHCDRYVLTFNGEIYNCNALKARLPAINWRGHSDSEIILEGFVRFGIAKFLPHLNGMFALALYDRQKRTLTLARDRMGIKPLYYAQTPKGFIFGSELKALQHKGALNKNALHTYLRLGTIPAPHTIYEGVFKLKPAEMLVVTEKITSHIFATHNQKPFQGSYVQASEQLEHILKDAIARQSLTDVPLGAFLSGGVDSSTVAALLQAQSLKPIKTFTIGFNEKGFNEAEQAQLVAKHLGTDHHELYVSEKDALDVIPSLGAMYDEPFADSSQIPTFLVSKMARQQVTVALSGDGGDELFAGYRRYLAYEGGIKYALKTPLALRQLLAKLPIKSNSLTKIIRALQGDKEAYYLSLLSQFQNPAAYLLEGHEPPLALLSHANFTRQMQLNDIAYYLPDDILTKVDRASMAVSLEARVPLLDNDVVDFALSLPPEFNIRHGQGKMLLREVLYNYVPKTLIERPKVGFAIPLDTWLRGSLKDYAQDLLNPATLKAQGILNTHAVTTLLEAHLLGKANNSPQIWALLRLQEFLKQ